MKIFSQYQGAQSDALCGHGHEVLPIPGKDEKCDLVPVIGEAW